MHGHVSTLLWDYLCQSQIAVIAQRYLMAYCYQSLGGKWRSSGRGDEFNQMISLEKRLLGTSRSISQRQQET